MIKLFIQKICEFYGSWKQFQIRIYKLIELFTVYWEFCTFELLCNLIFFSHSASHMLPQTLKWSEKLMSSLKQRGSEIGYIFPPEEWVPASLVSQFNQKSCKLVIKFSLGTKVIQPTETSRSTEDNKREQHIYLWIPMVFLWTRMQLTLWLQN